MSTQKGKMGKLLSREVYKLGRTHKEALNFAVLIGDAKRSLCPTMGFSESDPEMLLDKAVVDRKPIDYSNPTKMTENEETRTPPTMALALVVISFATTVRLTLLPHEWVDGDFIPSQLFKDHLRMFYVVVTSNVFAFGGSYCALFIRNSKPKVARVCEICALALLFFELAIFLYVLSQEF